MGMFPFSNARDLTLSFFAVQFACPASNGAHSFSCACEVPRRAAVTL